MGLSTAVVTPMLYQELKFIKPKISLEILTSYRKKKIIFPIPVVKKCYDSLEEAYWKAYWKTLNVDIMKIIT